MEEADARSRRPDVGTHGHRAGARAEKSPDTARSPAGGRLAEGRARYLHTFLWPFLRQLPEQQSAFAVQEEPDGRHAASVVVVVLLVDAVVVVEDVVVVVGGAVVAVVVVAVAVVVVVGGAVVVVVGGVVVLVVDDVVGGLVVLVVTVVVVTAEQTAGLVGSASSKSRQPSWSRSMPIRIPEPGGTQV